MSAVEFKRGLELLTLQDAGQISDLKFQPRFPLIVNGVKVGTYIADAQYVENGVEVVEDSKSKSWIDEVSKLKISLYQALSGVKVRIPQRKEGKL